MKISKITNSQIIEDKALDEVIVSISDNVNFVCSAILGTLYIDGTSDRR